MKRLLLLPLLLSLIVGCVGTRSAYKVADSPYEQAYVVAEHYAALVHEAADLKEQGLPPNILAKIREADLVANPLIKQLWSLAAAYKGFQSSENEEILRIALGRAAIALSNFVNVIKEARTQ